MLETGHRALDLLRPGAHRAGYPIELPQPVVDRSADAGHRERLELDAALEVEPLDRIDQSEHTRADEVTGIDTGGKPGADPTGDELDERRVVHDQVIAGGRVSVVEPGDPLQREVGIFVNDAHARGCVSR